MKKDIYQEYALLQAQINALEAKKEEMRVTIISDMIEKNVEKIESAFGKFSVTKTKKWSYPSFVTELEDEVKAKKALAQSTGDATYTESETLRFTEAKI